MSIVFVGSGGVGSVGSFCDAALRYESTVKSTAGGRYTNHGTQNALTYVKVPETFTESFFFFFFCASMCWAMLVLPVTGDCGEGAYGDGGRAGRGVPHQQTRQEARPD